jgi:hypothetical protein
MEADFTTIPYGTGISQRECLMRMSEVLKSVWRNAAKSPQVRSETHATYEHPSPNINPEALKTAYEKLIFRLLTAMAGVAD